MWKLMLTRCALLDIILLIKKNTTRSSNKKSTTPTIQLISYPQNITSVSFVLMTKSVIRISVPLNLRKRRKHCCELSLLLHIISTTISFVILFTFVWNSYSFIYRYTIIKEMSLWAGYMYQIPIKLFFLLSTDPAPTF